MLSKKYTKVPSERNPRYEMEDHKQFFTEKKLKRLVSIYFQIKESFGLKRIGRTIFPIFVHKFQMKLFVYLLNKVDKYGTDFKNGIQHSFYFS